ncbi:MAG: molecular chaperone DnaK, partial [Cyanobacteriota bacterium]
IASLREAVSEENLDQMRERTSALTQVMYDLSSSIYSKENVNTGAEQEHAHSTKSDDDIVDAEYEEVK